MLFCFGCISYHDSTCYILFLTVNIDVIAQLCPKLSKVDVGLVMIKSYFFVMIEFGIDNMGVQIHWMEPRVWGGTTVRSNIPRLDTLQNATNERTTTSNCYHFFVFEEVKKREIHKICFWCSIPVFSMGKNFQIHAFLKKLSFILDIGNKMRHFRK